MINNFCKVPLYKVTKTLSAVAMGRQPADTVITGAKLINVCTAEILDKTDVAISCGRIALVGDAKHCIGKDTKVIEACGCYIAPGFLDGHMHLESSMMSVGEYARAVVPHGTVGVYADPHEMCNVLGLAGVSCMVQDAKRTPLKVMMTTPSCVPAVPGFEDTGASIDANDIGESMKDDFVVGLGEMMNYPGIIASDDGPHDEVAETLKAGKIVTGHYPSFETGRQLNAYLAAGIRSCHESTRAEDVLAKLRLGMYAQIREGSAWHDLDAAIKSITENRIDTRFVNLISDDTHPQTLYDLGHMDYLVQRAVKAGVDVITAIQMVTINCAQCFQMDHELGSISPGKCADIVFIDDLEKVSVCRTIIDGEVVSENGKLVAKMGNYTYPTWVTHSMHIKGEITRSSFEMMAEGRDRVTVRVIEIIPEKCGTNELHMELDVKNGFVESDTKQDILKTVVFERHKSTGKVGYGFVKGFGIKCGAMASTVSHDAHNLLVVGTNDADMAVAANALVECGGGMAVVRDGKVLGLVELPIAGLLNNKTAEEMSKKVDNLEKGWRAIGCDIVSPFMTMSLIALACIPQLRLTDRGLVDCVQYKMVPLFINL